MDADGSWLVARRLSGPGVARLLGTIVIDAELRERLDVGDVVIEAFTSDYPFGAAKATLLFAR